ncbi:DUF4399 domain-containing protein [Pandoraea terrae]|nr:DUF4399 domain-containing protein [Pandoraea terrae]
MRTTRYLLVPLLLTSATAATAAMAAERVYFVAPKDDANVMNPVTVKFGVDGMTVAPAGTATPGTGHHHLIIDGTAEPKGDVVPTDDTHLHFGKGQTETQIKLTPGDHTLTLQFADGAHRSFGPAMSQTIKVHVTGSN